MSSRPKGAIDGVPTRVMVAIIAMLVLILLPATLMSQPFSKIVITVSNTDAEKAVSVYLDVRGADDGYFSLLLAPGQEQTVTCPVRAGTHDVHLQYWYSGDHSSLAYGQSIWESYSVWLFETEEVKFDLAPPLVAGTWQLVDR